ncbi:MAG: hypothetical protein AB8E74_01475 [Prochlorococcus sp.]
MNRRRPTLLDRLMHQWRRLRRHELNRTLRHMRHQEKRATYVKAYVNKSLDSIDRAEGRIKGPE